MKGLFSVLLVLTVSIAVNTSTYANTVDDKTKIEICKQSSVDHTDIDFVSDFALTSSFVFEISAPAYFNFSEFADVIGVTTEYCFPLIRPPTDKMLSVSNQLIEARIMFALFFVPSGYRFSFYF